DCLNVRVAAGRTNDAIVCLNDGEVVTVSGGPVAADGFNWWQVKTALGEGWAAEEYLSKRP
ncbi:MAG: SH3 domain-containing protein, partial [Tepidiformaceae bacterium]